MTDLGLFKGDDERKAPDVRAARSCSGSRSPPVVERPLTEAKLRQIVHLVEGTSNETTTFKRG